MQTNGNSSSQQNRAPKDTSKDGCESLLPTLQQMQGHKGGLGVADLNTAAERSGVSTAHAYGAASFYSMLSLDTSSRHVLRVCVGPACQLFGCEKMHAELSRLNEASDVRVERSSCLGLCDRAPAALVEAAPCGPLVRDGLDSLWSDTHDASPTYREPRSGEQRVALDRIASLDAGDFDSVRRAGAYDAVLQALQTSPEQVRRTVKNSGLRGLGGAGFPTGDKWELVAGEKGFPKYVVCNADESEPATFKDRVLLEADPHLVLEGMLLAGFAVGARHGYIYVRGEYEVASQRLEHAVAEAMRNGFLGEAISGTEFSFDVHVHRGAGAYICGEETALLESLEGRRGEPRLRPPFPTSRGLRSYPTVVNNVETLCKAVQIFRQGAEWYRSVGTAGSPGTKLFSVAGHVRCPGVFEVPFGITLRTVIDVLCGGMREGSKFKFALTGGAAGTMVGQSSLDVPLDFEAVERGVAIGSGGIVVCDESVAAPDFLRNLLRFFAMESCGKCTPCRIGTDRAADLVEKMASGTAAVADHDELCSIVDALRLTSLCGLGKSVAWPIQSALKNFATEFCIGKS